MLLITAILDRPGRSSGTGIPVDLAVFRAVREASAAPVVLAGGLTPGKLQGLLAAAKPAAVDALTGVKERPGHKDSDKLKKFMRAVSLLEDQDGL